MEYYRKETFTPKKAKAFLDKHNLRNRPINRHKLQVYINDMVQGKWKETPIPIVVGSNDVLLDGQYRLTALIEADIILNFVVCYDADPAIFDVLDTNRPRSAADVLHVESYEDSILLSSLVGKIISYQRWGISRFNVSRSYSKSHGGITNADVLAYTKAHTHYLKSCISFSKIIHGKKGKIKLLPQATVAFLYWLLYPLHGEKIGSYLQAVLLGIGLELKSAEYYVNSKLVKSRADPLYKLDMRVKMVLILKGFLLSLKGKEVNHFQFLDEDFSNILEQVKGVRRK